MITLAAAREDRTKDIEGDVHRTKANSLAFLLWLVRPYEEWHVFKIIQKLERSEKGNQRDLNS